MEARFVGREAELVRLRAAVDAAQAGQRQVMLVSGEAGIGKTRLVREIERYAVEHDAIACWGRSREAAGAPPYWPWTQAGRALGDQLEPQHRVEVLRPNAADLRPIFPELGDLLGESPPRPEGEAASIQFQLFEAMASLLRRVAEQRPLVVVLEDLHWADRGSLLLFGHLAAELGATSVLLVGTYRDAELGTNEELSALVAELNREAGFGSIPLAGLSSDDIAEYVDFADHDARSLGSVEEIRRRTGGNPFFLEQLTALSELSQDPTDDPVLPDGLRAALAQRLAPLSADATDFLSVAAIIGQEFTHSTLTLLQDPGEEARLLPIVEEVLAARVIEETSEPGRYRFVHDLMRQALLTELPATRRALLHGRVAEALERRWQGQEDRFASRLAAHYLGSAAVNQEHVAPALRYALRAAQQAERENAWDSALQVYEQALLVADQSDAAEDVILELLIGLGRAYRVEDRLSESWRTFERAMQLARDSGHAVHLARAAIECRFGPGARAVDWVRQALHHLEGSDPRLEARLHADLLRAIRRPFVEEQELVEHRRRAVELAEAHEFTDVTAAIRHGDMVTAEFERAYPEAIRAGQEARRLFESVGMPSMAMDALHRVATNALFAGDLELARRCAQECEAQSRRTHMSVWESLAKSLRLAVHLHRTEFDEAFSLADEPQRSSVVPLAMQLPLPFIAVGDLERAGQLVDAVSSLRGVDVVRVQLHAIRARYLVALGARGEALQEFELLSRAAERDPRAEVAAGWSYTHAAIADLDEAFIELAPLEVLRDWFDSDPERPPYYRCGSPLLRYAQAGLKLGELERAREAFEELMVIAIREGTPIVEAHCHLGMSALATSIDEAAEAQEHAARARASVAHLPPTPVHRAVEAALASLADEAGEAPAVPAGLTSRELEVLGHVAAGRSSREIAEALVLSVRTVERHIANIYRKTDTHGRAQATAFAIRHGLDQPSVPPA